MSQHRSLSLIVLLIVAGRLGAQAWCPAPVVSQVDGLRMTFDSGRSRAVMFGGRDCSLRGHTWEFTGSAWRYIPTATAPPTRFRHALVYDSVRRRTVLFGGSAGQVPLADTWEYDGTDWQQVSTATAPSMAAGEFALAFDSARGRTVLFGRQETWEYDGVNWARISTAVTPGNRTHHAMAFDSARARTVMFGGTIGMHAGFGDTWEYDGLNWSQMSTAVSPAGRFSHEMVYDSGRGRTVLVGGAEYYSHGSFATLVGTWEYDGVNWLQVSGVAPHARLGHALAHDSIRGRTVLFGGASFADTWEYDGAAWLQVNVAAPYPDRYVAIAYDSGRGRAVFMGSIDGATWEYDGGHWIAVNSTVGPRRRGHGLVYDSARGRCVLFGGNTYPHQQPGVFGDTWEYDGSLWSQVSPASVPPPRGGHAMAFDSLRSRTVLFGGYDASGLLADTWEYDGVTWSHVTTAMAPPPRGNHSLVYDSSRARCVLFGGNVMGGPDTWEYDGTNWSQVLTAASPPWREHHACAYDGSRARVVVFGGTDRFTALGDTWEYDGADWTRMTPGQLLLARIAPAMTYDTRRGRVILAGGFVWSISWEVYQETWDLVPPAVPTWARLGRGCPGSSGTPGLTPVGSALPALGTSFPLQISGLPSQAGAAWLAFGLDIAQWQGRPLPIAMGIPPCQLWIAPVSEAGVLLLHSGNSAVHLLSIPADPILAGLRVAAQALVLDPLARNGIAALSDAGIATVY